MTWRLNSDLLPFSSTTSDSTGPFPADDSDVFSLIKLKRHVVGNETIPWPYMEQDTPSKVGWDMRTVSREHASDWTNTTLVQDES